MSHPLPADAAIVQAADLQVGDRVYCETGWLNGPEATYGCWRRAESIRRDTDRDLAVLFETFAGEGSAMIHRYDNHTLVIVRQDAKAAGKVGSAMARTGVGPIAPGEVATVQTDLFPREVFEAFNELIARGGGGYVEIPVRSVVALMVQKGLDRREIHCKGWLNVEPAYRNFGWNVTFDRPGIDETYPEKYIFSRK